MVSIVLYCCIINSSSSNFLLSVTSPPPTPPHPQKNAPCVYFSPYPRNSLQTLPRELAPPTLLSPRRTRALPPDPPRGRAAAAVGAPRRAGGRRPPPGRRGLGGTAAGSGAAPWRARLEGSRGWRRTRRRWTRNGRRCFRLRTLTPPR